jgi:serine/threonine protein kinase
MTPERWEQVKRIFDAALSLSPGERNELVKRSCHGDHELESEVGNLLEADDLVGSFLEIPAVGMLGLRSNSGASPSLAINNTIAGRFEILRFLSSGGMGEVYEAWDIELRERVALKTIRPEIASDERVIERFKAEVKQARGISHTNVCRVFDLFSHQLQEGRRLWFLTMELLPGQTLLQRIRQEGPFSPNEAFDLVSQMAAGLSAAHRLGIVHRDFKSSNVMLVSDGARRPRVVITDFGLSLNVTGTVERCCQVGGEGTPDYMAPEQKLDGEVSFSADQYALGVVVCEILTGVRPRVHTAGVHRVELPHHRTIPTRWKTVIFRCLEQFPENRFESVDDVIPALTSKIRRLWKSWGVWAACIVMGLLLATLVLTSGTETGLDRLTQITPGTDLSGAPSLSSDGKILAYMSDRAEAGNLDIWVQTLPSGNPTRITTDPADDIDPSISPNGASVVFRSEREGGGIYIADTAGGKERLLVRKGRNPRFSPDGQRIAYWIGDRDETVASGQIYLLSLNPIGPPIRIASQFIAARFPVWRSDGKSILFTGCRSGDGAVPMCSDWWLAATSYEERK